MKGNAIYTILDVIGIWEEQGALVSAVLLEVLSQFSDRLPQTKEIRRKLIIVLNILLVVLADFIKSEYIFHS